MKGGCVAWRCNFCNMQKSGTYSRVRAHLLKISLKGIAVCTKILPQEYDELKRLDEEVTDLVKSRAPKKVPLPQRQPTSSDSSLSEGRASASYASLVLAANSMSTSTCPDQSQTSACKRKKGQLSITEMFAEKDRDEADYAIARFFYANGISFNVARSHYFIEMVKILANKHLKGYIPPKYDALREKFLKEERKNIDMLLEPIRSTWEQHGVTIVSDGWTDPQRKPLINFLATNESGCVFLGAENCEGEFKGGDYIAGLLKGVIQQVGRNNVVQIITDNASNCKRAGKIIEEENPKIFWTPCVVHTINLGLKDIAGAENLIKEVSFKAKDAKTFITRHNRRDALFHKFSKKGFLHIAETRFASLYTFLERFHELEEAMRSMVTSKEWASCRGDDQTKAVEVKNTILDDSIWESIRYILSFMKPIVDMLRFCDTETPSLHLIYGMWDTMFMEVKKAIISEEYQVDICREKFCDVVQHILHSRFTQSITPLHAVAHSLNPKCSTIEWKELHPNLLPPESDSTISQLRDDFLERYFPDDDIRIQVKLEFGRFLSRRYQFADRESIYSRSRMEPVDWWYIYGSSTPNLQSLAFRLLGHLSSSSASERNWSTYSFVHSVRRNKLDTQRVEDLVYVHTNLRLLSRKAPHYKEGTSMMWDVGGDAQESLRDIGIFEIANLSLNEPELEAVMFNSTS